MRLSRLLVLFVSLISTSLTHTVFLARVRSSPSKKDIVKFAESCQRLNAFLECSFARRDRTSAVLSGVLEEKLKTVGIHGQCLTVKAIAVDLRKGLAGQALLNVGLKAGNALGVGGVGWGVHCVDMWLCEV